ncbi:MAG TPA: hypothetical protein VMT52_06115, partial [Planctomycetota bacterium]|nr:hypothetical protein [Planctomycetota bacterium]
PQDPEGALPFHYLGLAACEHNLGYADRAKRNLENAGLALASDGHLFNKARAASVLCAFHRYLENAEEVANWEAFIDRLNCPEATKQLTRKRAAIIVARCQEKSNLVLMFG